jgi:hypothetical protein
MVAMTLRLHPRARKRALALVAALMAVGALAATSAAAPAHAAGGSCGGVTTSDRGGGSIGIQPDAENCDMY